MKQYLGYSILIMLFFSLSCKSDKQSSTGKEQNSEIVSKEVTDVVLSYGKIIRVEEFPSEFVKARNVDVWLPDDYSEETKYAVLYMHDGQMLFDATQTWNKQEWKVDEISKRLLDDKKVRDYIVVAIWNISDIRWQDYFPQKAFEFLSPDQIDSIKTIGGGNDMDMTLNADNYLKFITQEVKPYIDNTYSTLSGRNDTFVSGSSMGGLISMYAICEYPEVFGGAACISTHWPGGTPNDSSPLPEAIFSYMDSRLPDPETHKFYFDFGTETLDQYYPQYEDRVNTIFTNKGFDRTNFRNLKFEGQDHSENSWNQRFHIPLIFLLGQQDE